MNRIKWFGLVISTSLISSGLMAIPGNAQPPNQSDITGTNIWNNTAPIFDEGGELAPEILDQARRLDQALEEASDQCYNARESTTTPRRFARNPGNSNQACTNPNCQELNRLVEETKVFLDDVNRTQAEQARASSDRLW